MAFEIIKMEVLRDRMITWFSGIQNKVTDYIVGGKTFAKFEAISIELESMLYDVYQAIKKAIPIAIYQAFGFKLIAAVKASGVVTFTANPAAAQDIVIPAGTEISTPMDTAGQTVSFVTAAAVTMPQGQTTITATAICTTPGPTGNVDANSLTVIRTPVPGLTSVTNANAISNGKSTETEAERKIRFNQFISTLPRGTDAALVYGAKTTQLVDGNGNITERVTDAITDGPPETGSAGLVTLYIFNGSNGASADLITACQTIIDGQPTAAPPVPGYKAAGVVVTVAAVTTTPTAVTMVVTADAETDKVALKSRIETIIQAYMANFQIGQTLIFNELVERVMSLPGVYDVTISQPAANVTQTKTQVIVPGTITVTVN